VGWSTFRNRHVAQLENDGLRVTVTAEGGHIAEITHKPTGVNPLWTPPWTSIEPSTYNLEKHPQYGNDAESKLLSGIMGHNLCLDLFGGPSAEEAAAGMTVHGEASVARYKISFTDRELTASCELPAAQLKFERHIRIAEQCVLFTETVENVSILDRPIAWTEHVTLGPPFLEKGVTQFRAPGTKGHNLGTKQDFAWPLAPRTDGKKEDLRVYTDVPVSGSFDSVLMDPHNDRAFFFAFHPRTKVLFGYVWNRADFPWLGIWVENYERKLAPWSGRTLTRGMEFGASPVAESRRQMIDRNTLFGVPAYRWIPAKSKLRAEYWAFITSADSIPNSLEELQVHVPA
jgi:hypothetical protein